MDKPVSGHRADIYAEIKRLGIKRSVHQAHIAIIESKIYELESDLQWLNTNEEN